MERFAEKIVQKCVQMNLIEENQSEWLLYSLQRRFMNIGGFLFLILLGVFIAPFKQVLLLNLGLGFLREKTNAAIAITQVCAGRAIQSAQHSLRTFLLEPCVGVVGQQIGAFFPHTVIVGGGDAQVRADLPMRDASNSHGFDQLGAAVV